MERQVITTRVELLLKYIDRIEEFEPVSFDEYFNSFDLQLIAERLIQLIVESASDINTYLLVQLHQTTPATYIESFIKAGSKGIISKKLAAELAKSAGMRNILVHQYKDIDHEIVFAAIPEAVEQYQFYIQQITAYLNSLEADNG